MEDCSLLIQCKNRNDSSDSFLLALIRLNVKSGQVTSTYYRNGKNSKERACLKHLYEQDSVHVLQHEWSLEYAGQSSQFLAYSQDINQSFT